MTREEAINEIKSWDFLEGKEIEAIHTLIPELRESEDERILVRLIEYFQGFLKGYEDCYKDGSCVKWEGLDVKSILAFLEKQKKTADSFTDGIIEVRSFQRGMEEGRKLETQKEPGIKWLKSDNVKNPDKPYVDKVGMFYTTDGRMCYASEIEQQKEQKHPNGCFTCDEYKKGYKEGRRNGFTAGYNKAMKEVEQKEQKPVQSEEEKEYVRTLKGLVSDFIRDNDGGITDIEYYQNICDWLDGRHIEQKPVEYLSKDKVYAIMNKLTNLSYSNLIPLDSDEYKKIYEITSDVCSLLDYPIEQKPAEWSEEDERKLQECIKIVERWEGDYDIAYTPYSNFLKSLRPSWKPSEEQMEALKECGECKRCIKELYEQLKSIQ